MKTNEAELEKQARTMRILIVNGQNHVIGLFKRNDPTIKEPDYRGTGNALLGVLAKGEKLESFKKKWLNRNIKLMEI